MWLGHTGRSQRIKEEIERTVVQGIFTADAVGAYLATASEDYATLLDRIHRESRPNAAGPYPSHTLTHRVGDGMIFDVNVGMDDASESVDICFSLGALLSLDDFFLRLACNMDFFSFDPERGGQRQWHGCDCVWFSAVGSMFPNARFYDYRQQLRPTRTSNGHGTFLSGFLEGWPTDVERQTLAFLLVDIATCWLLMHEEGHYAEGHLDYLMSQSSGARSGAMGEVSADPCGDDGSINKALEWQADRAATRAVIDLFFRQDHLQRLPTYCGVDRRSWMFRLILVAIGSVIHIIQKARQIQGTHGGYPEPRTRLLAAIHVALGHAHQNPAPGTLPLVLDQGNALLEFVQFIQVTVMGALEDLETASDLINQDGEVLEVPTGQKPTLERTRVQGLLDSSEEMITMGNLLLQSMLPPRVAAAVEHPGGVSEPQVVYQRWFSELESIIAFHDAEIWDMLAPHRLAAGNDST